MHAQGRFLAAFSILIALSISLPALAEGQAFRVRSFPLSTFDGMIGDREGGTDGAFWFAEGGYGDDSAVRFETGGRVQRWRIDDGSTGEVFPLRVQWDSVRRLVWVLGYRTDVGTGYLYRLIPASGEVTRTAIPFRALHLALDAAGDPWVFGGGKAASLSGTKLHTLTIPRFLDVATRADAAGRVWLQSENNDGSLLALRLADRTLYRYPSSASSLLLSSVAPNGDVWGVRFGQDRLVRFRPATREQALFPFTHSRYPGDSWAGMATSSSFTAFASYLGPHLYLNDVTKLAPLESVVLPEPETSSLLPEVTDAEQSSYTSSPTEAAVEFEERIFYTNAENGRQLFTSSASPFNALIWAGAGDEFLTGQRPLQWWRPLPAAEDFTTRAFLPAVVEVRPSDPINNFFSEVTVLNIDAASTVKLTLTLSGGANYSTSVTVPPNGTSVFPNVIQTFRDAGAALPSGDIVGTLAAEFANGTGKTQARVYSRSPSGSTTGLGLTSLDPVAESFVFRRSLNGLKNTSRYRTNIAVANLCGFAGTCPVLDVSADFFDDSTGQPVGTAVNFQVPPNEWRQVDSPLVKLGDIKGETFSVVFQPFSAGQTSYDAYATVIDSDIQDFVFIRASAVGASNTVSLSAVSDADGVGTRWTSECSITNTTGSDAIADLTFTSAITGKEVKHVLNLGNAQGTFYQNTVDFFRKIDPASVEPNDYGPVRVQFRNFGSGFISSRTVASNGMGLGMVGIDPYYTRAQWRRRILGLKETDKFRTNLAVVNLGPTRTDPKAPIQLSVTILDRDGKQVGSPLTKTLQPGQLFQWNQILAKSFSTSGEGYLAIIERTDGLEPFDAYITVIDNDSQDPTFVRAE